MRTVRKLILLAALLAGCAQPMSQAPTAPAANAGALDLAAAETAFAERSVREGVQRAFLANFAGDGVIARGSWTPARAWLSTHPDPPVLLEWKPVHTEVSASQDMGLSTGPWRLTNRKQAAAPTFGQFVSVWRREPGGDWKVIVDLGTSNPRATFWNFPLEALPEKAAAAPRDTIEQAEKRFEAELISRGPSAAYTDFASLRLRCYRENYVPMVGRGISIASFLAEQPRATWKLEDAAASRAGDFGYARGTVIGKAGKPAGHFLRVWRAEEGEWRIVMDVVQPA